MVFVIEYLAGAALRAGRPADANAYLKSATYYCESAKTTKELLNSKSEWQQAKVIRTTVRVEPGGAEILQPAPPQAPAPLFAQKLNSSFQ